MKKLIFIFAFLLAGCDGTVDLAPPVNGITESDVRAQFLATGGNTVDVLQVDEFDLPLYLPTNSGMPVDLKPDATFSFKITCADGSEQMMPWRITGHDAVIAEFWHLRDYLLFLKPNAFACGKAYKGDAAYGIDNIYFANNPLFDIGYGAHFRVRIVEAPPITVPVKGGVHVSELHIGI